MRKLGTIILGSMLTLLGTSTAFGAEISVPVSCYQGNTYLSYRVVGGDTLYNIGQTYGFDAQTLAVINQVPDAQTIRVGQILLIPSYNDVNHQVLAGESLSEVADLYGVNKLEIALANDLWDGEILPAGVQLSIPGLTHTEALSRQLTSRAGSSFVPLAPVVGTLTSSYGYRNGEFHTGMDIACEIGTPVKAAENGQVIFAGWDGNYGNAVVIDHKNGYKTRYAHNSEVKVTVGQYVAKGQIVALSGSTGRSTGPHVHLEIIEGGLTQNPAGYL